MDRKIGLEPQWVIKTYAELSKEELYLILHLRSKIFVLEQESIYLDADFCDNQAYHLMGCLDGRIVAYCRLFEKKMFYAGYSAIGRVLVDKEFRGGKLGDALLKHALCFLKESGQYPVKIAAQAYLEHFYTGLGFVKEGGLYLLDGIDHMDMVVD